MINFRFHIISLTAVFIAFAVGLVLGTSFLDDATERALNNQLNNLQDDLGTARSNNAALQAEIDRFSEEDSGLDDPLGERLLTDSLADDPVLVIAPEGLEDDPVARTVDALTRSGADYVGAWLLTDRLVLDDDDEIEDLATALQIPTDDDVERLRRGVTGDLASVLFLAIHSSDTDDTAGLVGATSQPAEPARLAALHEGGFVNYQLPEGSDSDVVLLPPSGLRVVVVTGTGGAVPSEEILLPTLTDLVSDGPAPVVVTARTPTEDNDENSDGVSALVASVRDDSTLAANISTVDDLELVSGWLATPLALQAAAPADPQIGHYGLGARAEGLLPALPGSD